ncbi:CCA tRNA nucleotidyltransferase [Helicobacter trogontum]|uniref:CCA tRNA nucleotidyltransferase n=1 Tax=Helicobacter trogontum TaxID=50960 RepID=UPI000CF09F36|nr:polynucleotide adenylyltransferase [Helicobacter trogontum]
MQSYILSIQIPNHVINILKILEAHHFEAYIIGGCVRDSLLGLQPKDWDITSNATPTQTQQIFDLHQDFEIIPIGLKYGTLGIKDKKTGDIVEITTYRTDGVYKDGRRPETIRFAQTLQEDISRRDFTINALACKIIHKNILAKRDAKVILPLQWNIHSNNYILNPLLSQHVPWKQNSTLSLNDYKKLDLNNKILDSTHTSCLIQLLDYHNGIKHLQERKIVCVGNAKKRFLEDSLRIMRSIRFTSVLPFAFTLHNETKQAALLLTPRLSYIANERILAEFTKLLCGQYTYKILPEYQSIVLFILPHLKNLSPMQLLHNYNTLKIAPKNTILRLSLLFCPTPYSKDIYKNKEKLQEYLQRYKAICKQLHFDNKTIQTSHTLLQLLCDTNIFTTQKRKITLKYLLLQHDTQIISQLILLYTILQTTYERNFRESSLKDSVETPPYNMKKICALTQDLNEIIITKECYKLSQLNINGNALQDIAKSLGVSMEGKQIGILLTKLLHVVIEEEVINTYDSLENIARVYITKLS